METKFIELKISHTVILRVPANYKYSVDDDSFLHEISEEAQAAGIGEWDLNVDESPSYPVDEFFNALYLGN